MQNSLLGHVSCRLWGCHVTRLSQSMSISSTSLAAPIFAMAPVKNGTLAVAGGGSSKTGIANSLVGALRSPSCLQLIDNFRGLQTKICVEETAGGIFELGKCQKHSLGSTCLFSVAASADVRRAW